MPASSPSLEVQAAQAKAEESASELGSPPPASDSASEDTYRPGVGTDDESQPSISPAP